MTIFLCAFYENTLPATIPSAQAGSIKLKTMVASTTQVAAFGTKLTYSLAGALQSSMRTWSSPSQTSRRNLHAPLRTYYSPATLTTLMPSQTPSGYPGRRRKMSLSAVSFLSPVCCGILKPGQYHLAKPRKISTLWPCATGSCQAHTPFRKFRSSMTSSYTHAWWSPLAMPTSPI